MNMTNWTTVGIQGLNETVNKMNFAELIRANCQAWSNRMLFYGIALIVSGIALKLIIDYEWYKDNPLVCNVIMFICYLIPILIGCVLIGLVFL
jgi:hypothetical protein